MIQHQFNYNNSQSSIKVHAFDVKLNYSPVQVAKTLLMKFYESPVE